MGEKSSLGGGDGGCCDTPGAFVVVRHVDFGGCSSVCGVGGRGDVTGVFIVVVLVFWVRTAL